MNSYFPQRLRTAAVGLLTVLACTASFVGTAQAQGSRLDEIVKRDKLIVATFGTAPPFCYTDENGKLVGFDIDIARLIAKSLLGDENKVEFVTVTSEGRWPAVNSGRADIGLASTTVYPDRALRVAFSRPYIDSSISILVRQDAKVNSLADLNNSKFTLANLSNPQMADRQKRFLPNVKVLTFDTPSTMFAAVKSGTGAGDADGYAGGELVRGKQQGPQGSPRKSRRHPGQCHLHEAGRLHAVAVDGHDGPGNDRRISLQRLHGDLSEVVRA